MKRTNSINLLLSLFFLLTNTSNELVFVIIGCSEQIRIYAEKNKKK